MYTTNYSVTGINSEDNGNVKSCLEAKFRFGKETGLIDRDWIRLRIKSPIQIFKDKGFYGLISKTGQVYYNKTETKKIVITPFIFRLGFDLNMEFEGEVPRKEMFNLDDLNNFILTGEILKK